MNLNKLQDNVEDAIGEESGNLTTIINTKLDKTSVKTTQTNSDTDTYSCNYINGLSGTLLWTNSNENTSFANQTIQNLGLNNYDMIEVFCKNYGSSAHKNIVSTRIPKNYNGYIGIIETDCALINRVVIVNWSSNSVEFEDAKFKSGTSSATTDNNRAIPIYIVGYKTNVF